MIKVGRKIIPNDTMVEAISLTSPSGKMSKAARRDADERLRVALFGKDGLAYPTCLQPSRREKLLRDAKMFRELADRGMSPRRYSKQAEQLEKQAAAIFPAWWMEEDTAVCQAYWSEEARQDMPHSDAPDLEADTEYMEALEAWCQASHPRLMEYTCRRCRFWSSADGKEGRCNGPEGSCGETADESMCEQWECVTQPNLL